MKAWQRVVVGILAVMAFLPGASALTHVVYTSSPCTDGDAHYSSIQSAVDASSNGDTIYVCEGTYNENLRVGKSISLIGAGIDSTTIAASPTSNGVLLYGDGITMSGFTVTGASAPPYSGIYLSGGSITLTHNKVHSNYRGISSYGAATGSNYHTVSNNLASNNEFGIQLSSDYITVTNNIVSDNRYGVQILSDYSTITENSAISNGQMGFHISSSSYSTISNNIAKDNSYAMYLRWSDNNIFYNNYLSGVSRSSDEGYYNDWNTESQAGTNIVGGQNIGGNYYTNSGGTGYSDTCADANSDGICDGPYTISTGNVDNFPIATSGGTPPPITTAPPETIPPPTATPPPTTTPPPETTPPPTTTPSPETTPPPTTTPPPVSGCTDSDGGKNYYVRGNTTNVYVYSTYVGVHEDKCLKDNQQALPGQEDILFEGYCDEEGVGRITSGQNAYHCPSGCQDGVCTGNATLPPETTPPPETTQAPTTTPPPQTTPPPTTYTPQTTPPPTTYIPRTPYPPRTAYPPPPRTIVVVTPPPVTTGDLSISSSPSSASVFINGRYRGNTPYVDYYVSQGEYTIKITKDGYEDYSTVTEVKPGGAVILSASLKEKRPEKGIISIISDPPGARVYIDGDEMGVTPLQVFDVSLTSHVIQLSKKGYKDYFTTADVSPDETYNIVADLTQELIDITNSDLSIQLYSVRDVISTEEDSEIILSAVSYIHNTEDMNLQAILKIPSGLAVSSVAFADSGAGQYVAYSVIKPGGMRQISANIVPTNFGEYEIEGELIYYFGDDKSTGDIRRINIPIKVKENRNNNRDVIIKGDPPMVCGPTILSILSVLPLILARRLKY
jgi:parallel beta-helix repeat protein